MTLPVSMRRIHVACLLAAACGRPGGTDTSDGGEATGESGDSQTGESGDAETDTDEGDGTCGNGIVEAGEFCYDPMVSFDVFDSVDWLRSGDVDGNGVADLVGSGFAVLGSGEGAFGEPVEFSVPERQLADGVVTDVDGDGLEDLVVVLAWHEVVGDVEVSLWEFGVFTSNGDASFDLDWIEMEDGGGTVSLARGDFDDDGDSDLLVLQTGGPATVFAGDGAGGFVAQAPIALPDAALEPWAANIDEDGDLDILVRHAKGPGELMNWPEGFSVMHGAGGLDFAVESGDTPEYPYESVVRGWTSARFDGDQHLDLVVARHDGSLSLARGGAGGTFGPVELLETLPGQVSLLRTGDFDSDGTADLTYFRDETVVSLGDGRGGFMDPVAAWPELRGTQLIADLDGDGVDDFAAGFDAMVQLVLSNP